MQKIENKVMCLCKEDISSPDKTIQTIYGTYAVSVE